VKNYFNIVMKIKLTNKYIESVISSTEFKFPKYSTQILNLAAQNSQATRPKVVGQLSELINKEFPGKTLKEWDAWYKKNNPETINIAADKIVKMIENFKEVVKKIDKKMIIKWVDDLVIAKSFRGLRFQEAILIKISEELKTTYKLAVPAEESRGIDGYIGKKPVSIKPITYKTKHLSEKIDAEIIYYDKKKDGITIEFDFD